jgi:uncharacterized RDD family membrane protein YckC
MFLADPATPAGDDRRARSGESDSMPTHSTAIPAAGQPIDATVRLDTPERIEFAFPLAGPFRRFVAYLIDLAILVGLVIAAFVAALLLSFGSSSTMGPALVAYFLLSWGYGAFFEGFFNGQTPGKRTMGLRVLSESGVPITGAQAFLRNLVGTVDGLVPFCYLLGLSSMLISPRFQRLGDLAAGTMVTVEERKTAPSLVRLQEPGIRSLVDRLPLRIAAGPGLARALSDYVRRRHRFSRGRREELAEPLAGPLRAQFGLAASEPADSVLCAVYHRVFLGE